MSRYVPNKDLQNVPEIYANGEYAYLQGPRGVDPEPYKIYKVLGDGQYKLSRNGKSDGRVYRAEDLLEDPGYGGGRQSREVVRLAKKKNLRVYNSPNLKPQDSGREVGAVAPTGHESGSLSVQGLDGTTQKDVIKFEPGMPGLIDYSTVTGDDDVLPETPSREDLSEVKPSTHSKRIDVHEASLEVINVKEEHAKAREERQKVITQLRELRKARKVQAKAKEERVKEFEVEMNSHERSDIHGFLAKPLKMDREEVDPDVFDGEISGGSLKMPFIKTETEDSLRNLARDTTIATGPETKRDWIDSLLSKLSVRGAFSQLFRQSPPTETRRWSFKSPLSVFGLGECLSERGKTRVRWRCVCGRKMHDDFIELRPGAAAELEKWLNHSIRDHAVNRASNSSQDYTLRSSNASSAGVSGQRQTAGSDISLQPLSWTASTMPDSDENGAVTIDVHLEKCWLLICGQPRRGPDSLLAQLELSSKPSDRELFDGMKRFHSSLRNTFTLQPVLKGVQTIRFVQFQLHKMARVDIRKFPDMPPETMRDEYLYEPCDLIPPVGENLMTHWFQHPEEAWDLPYAYSLFPKKRKDQLDVDLSQGPSVAWGIQIVEGWLGSRLWLLSLSLFLCGSLAFGICWTVLKHDIQGAFGVSAWIVAFLTLAVGAAQANLG